MKRTVSCIALAAASLTAGAQNTSKPAAKPAAKPGPVLKSYKDSLSYVLGEVAAYGLINQGFGDIKMNSTYFLRAVNDILGKKPVLLDDMTANSMLNNYMQKKQEEKARPNLEAGKKFLEENKKKPGVQTTASGLQYEVISTGDGPKPSSVDTFVCHYRGTLIDGTEFDASYNRNQPLTLGVSQVIAGWTEGLQLMATGSKYKFYIPYNLGYGMQETGSIPPGSTLIFEVELLEVKKKQ